MLDPEKQKDAHVIERLNTELIAWLSTVRPDGRPHVVPVWFLWQDGSILIFSQPNNQKIRNLRANPSVMLGLETINHGDDVVMVEGTAEFLDGEDAPTTILPAYAQKYDALLRSMNWDADTMAKSYSQAIRVTPTRFIV
jgi:PPOX class probable F420-dependent enzyme